MTESTRDPIGHRPSAIDHENREVIPGLILKPHAWSFLNGKDRSRIVGLYEGGHGYATGIFHPTGTCVMRRSHDGSAEFCAVRSVMPAT